MTYTCVNRYGYREVRVAYCLAVLETVTNRSTPGTRLHGHTHSEPILVTPVHRECCHFSDPEHDSQATAYIVLKVTLYSLPRALIPTNTHQHGPPLSNTRPLSPPLSNTRLHSPPLSRVFCSYLLAFAFPFCASSATLRLTSSLFVTCT